ncbi:MAG: BMP family ABC transporter substrate-binding protein [Bacillota bacterium]|nr:BMP family ABC transporter substrate-binding protein [Bacillota bacterium]
MKKRLLAVFLTGAVAASFFAGCTSKSGGTGKVKVGMATDSGTIDDKSFNQGTWEGIKKYQADKGTIDIKYLQPPGQVETDYINTINDLYDTGYKIIVTPGYKFETAVNTSADAHKDAAFVLIDGQTHTKDNTNFVKHDNVVCVFFSEQEAGFMAGVTAALSTKSNKLGFVGGMEIPPVQRYGFGYQAGVAYANKNMGTKAQIVDYVYQGTFDQVSAGQTLAAGMYGKGADIIFHAAGGVGVGVFNEAKQRAQSGSSVWVIGVDVDQFNDGVYDKASNKSVTLTSAMKRIDVAAYNYIDARLNNKFPGGQVITLSLKDNGVGIPAQNPNLAAGVVSSLDKVSADIVSGKIVVPKTQAELDAFVK